MGWLEELLADKDVLSKNFKAQFIAKKDEIATALERGCSKKSIWETMRKDEDFHGNYSTFCRYIKIIIEGKQPAKKESDMGKQLRLQREQLERDRKSGKK